MLFPTSNVVSNFKRRLQFQMLFPNPKRRLQFIMQVQMIVLKRRLQIHGSKRCMATSSMRVLSDRHGVAAYP